MTRALTAALLTLAIGSLLARGLHRIQSAHVAYAAEIADAR